jgi:hypothetical protein
MEPLRHLGHTLAALRSIAGVGIGDLVPMARLSAKEIEEAEQGLVSASVRGSLTSLFGLSPDELLYALARPSEGHAELTVFLLHGAFQDFDATDLGALDRAMRAARLLCTASDQARQGVRRRLAFVPVPVAGPLPRDAARQGYKLARRLRSELGLDDAPIDDIRALAELQLGAAVVVGELTTTDLRAASVLDAGRGGAALLLSSSDASRVHNPLLTRVYVAHELCHLLFDPARPGRVQIALDSMPHGPSSPSLHESRAKGFAAELLLPRQGVERVLGCRGTFVDSVSRARDLVTRTAAAFGTPWELSCYHLKNIDIISEQVVGELIQAGPGSQPVWATTLPEAGQLPLSLGNLVAAPPIWAAKTVPGDVPDYVLHARVMAAHEIESHGEAVLAGAYAEHQRGRPIAATDLLAERLDGWLSGGQLDRVTWVLEHLDAEHVPPEALTAALSVTRPAKVSLGEARRKFFERVMSSLEHTWHLPQDQRARIAQRLQ